VAPYRSVKVQLVCHLRWFQPHYLVDTVFADPPGVPFHFNDFFGHLDDCTKPLPVSLIPGNSLTNRPHAALLLAIQRSYFDAPFGAPTRSCGGGLSFIRLSGLAPG